MSVKLKTAPASYPVSLGEAKTHLHVEHDNDNALITGAIAAATDYAEQYLSRDLVQRTWEYSFDQFPVRGFCLPKNPVQSITSIKYIDTNGAEQTVSTDVYGVDIGVTPAEVYLKYNQSWPTARNQRNAVTVEFVSGHAPAGSPLDYGINVPDAIKSAILLIVGDLYLNRERKMDVQVYYNDTADMLLAPHRIYRL